MRPHEQSVSQPAGAAEVGRAVVARARRGDPDAFAQIVDRYDRDLRALAFRLLGDRHLMDDVLQESYVKAYRALPGFRGGSRLGTWLYRIVYNACMDELRRAQKVASLHPDDELAQEAPNADPHEAIGERSALGAALASLPPQERAAVLLVDAQGFDYAEAARILDVPPGTVASRLNRARATLRATLAAADEGMDAA